jgi:Sigma-70, region 4
VDKRPPQKAAPPRGVSQRITDGQLAAHAEHTSTGLCSAEDEGLRALPDTEIISALRAMPAGYRMAVYYTDVEGLSCKHIGEIMHTPVGTVVSRLRRGRRRLRVLLAGVATDRGIVRGQCLHMAPAPMTGPREVVHGERESFVGGYRWQRSGPALGSPRPNVGGGGR